MNITELDFKLIIPLATYRKIMAYVTVCDTEISGFADVEYNVERKALIAGEAYLLQQEAGAADTHMDEEAVHAFNLEMIKKGVTQLPRIWWHSHVNMEAFFSPTDENTLKDLQNDTFMIALVVNKKKALKAKMYVAVEIPMLDHHEHIEIDPLPLTVELDYERIPDAIKREVEKKVTTKKWTYPSVGNYLTKGKKEKKIKWEKEERTLTGVLYLPKSPEEALKRIEKLGLEKRWSYETGQWTYVDTKTGKTWVDYWDTLEQYDNKYDGN